VSLLAVAAVGTAIGLSLRAVVRSGPIESGGKVTSLHRVSHPARRPLRAPAGAGAAPVSSRTRSTAKTAAVTTTAPAQTQTPATTTTTTTAATTTTALLAPSSVLVEVLNGAGVPHLAATTAQALRAAGFLVNGTGNAASFQHDATVVEFSSGSEQAAETVAAYVSGSSVLAEVPGLAPDEVDLVLGEDFDGLRA
jgi:hypothetical protein